MNGLLLTNLGTPDDPSTGAVRRYLREFLWDRRVLDINPVGRALLLYGVILPFRPKKSAHAYQKIWTPAGSPLLIHGKALATAVQAELGPTWRVELAMRYGRPSIDQALERMFAPDAPALERLVVLPLYPQYASSSTGSTLERVIERVKARIVVPPLDLVQDFYLDRGFIDAAAAVARPELERFRPDHVLMSFHGLPERQVKACDPTGRHCLASATCCDAIVDANARCYRAQSFATARALVAELGIKDWSIGFQSRLGKIPWIRPFTDEVLVDLARRGVKRLAVMVPSFTADCLVTLEEIGSRARESFRAAGGEDLTAIACVNAHPRWVEAVAALARRRAGQDENPSTARSPAP
ncbi:MAG: ferrochelatase [Myxococcota bacterium]